jgi:hypothetical protein
MKLTNHLCLVPRIRMYMELHTYSTIRSSWWRDDLLSKGKIVYFIMVFTTESHWSLPSAEWIQFIPLHLLSVIHFNFILQPTP